MPRNITIDHNLVHNNELWGIQLNVWNSPAPDNFWFDINTTISSNIIYNNGGPFDHYAPGGTSNYDSGYGIISNGHTTGVTVVYNEIYGHTTGTGSRLKNNAAGIRSVADKAWTIKYNKVHDNFRGIYFYGSGYGLLDETTLHVVECNDVFSNAEGIVVSKSDAGTANRNNIYGNNVVTFVPDGYGPYGLRNLGGSGTFDATNNWWRDASGPTHSSNPGGVGDRVSDFVDFTNWLTTLATCAPHYHLTVSSAHDSPNPAAGTYDEPPGWSVTASVTSPETMGGTRYVCTGWTGSGSVPSSGSGTTVTFTITQDSMLTWTWKTQYYLTVKTDPPGAATIGGQGWYDANAAVTLTAPFVSGTYRFLSWDVDATSQGTTNPINVQMDGPHTATAHYSNSAVGGEWAPITLQAATPIGTLQLLAPWIALALLAIATAGAASHRLLKKHW
jgi:hypothetical protein